ncbi:hypothetical protein [Flavobacterium sp. GT3P67]|uniref:hypothetical protein n=1 Tax=Flavobacterium sp. GT3P67 TaxID=2541722 RepID=UPI001052FDCF|nr:hypothetical protein [Flavobacterium sp. GT3P67]TDE48574.1 hypothetical protein E0H99_16440 [Flavobacterium sp. GT3P67]
MFKKKGIVFDNQNYFSKIVKHKFKEYILFDTYNNFKNFDKKNNNYSILIFVIYSEDDVYNLLKVNNLEIPMIICAFNKERLMKLRRLENIMLLDASKLLPEIIVQLQSYFARLNILP